MDGLPKTITEQTATNAAKRNKLNAFEQKRPECHISTDGKLPTGRKQKEKERSNTSNHAPTIPEDYNHHRCCCDAKQR